MRIYLVRIPRRKGHSIQSIVRPGLVISRRSPASTVRLELAQTGRDLKLPSNPDRTTGRIWLVISSCCFGAAPGPSSLGTMQLTWAEDRALLWKQPERRPRGQDRMGRHDAALFHSGLALKR